MTLGAIIGFSLGDDPPPCDLDNPLERALCEILDKVPPDQPRYSAEEKAVMLGLASGGCAAILGAVIGNKIGKKNRYKFETKEVKSGQ